MKRYTLLIMLISSICLAQNTPPPPGLPDPPAVSINSIDIILLVTAIYLGFYFILRNKLKR
jgi:hypothetical protein